MSGEKRDKVPAGQSMLPEDWDELAPLLDRILDTPRPERASLFASLSDGDALRQSRLEQLVADCERDAPMLEQTAFERFDLLLDEPATVLPPLLADRYRTGRELGRGGMARVYLAHDLKHERDVAVKVIRPELAASLGRDQFLREIAIAARLRHPNIVPLYDSGDDGGALYFVMPFEAGPSLREKLANGPLPIPDVLSALRDVARALSYAHEQGIVHRDVKPDNVMLSSGAAVVTDFGIARAVRVAQADAPMSSLIHTGAMGTPAYMAPEQATSEATSDHRADIYSFGCMAYELLTGKPPFEGESVGDLLTAHAKGVPRSVNERRPETPAQLEQLIVRCLAKDPAARPQSAAELITALDAISPSVLVAPRRRRVLRVRTVIAIAIAAMIGVAGYLMISGRGSTAGSAPSGPVTLAVLPFSGIGGDPAHAMLAEGLSSELASSLVRVPWVRVMSRRGVSNYRGQRDIDYRQTGRELGARYLLTGTVRENLGREIITLQLVSAADGTTLWSNRFDRPSTQVESERDEMAQAIAQALRPLAGASATTVSLATSPQRLTSGEAYFFRVQAQQWLDRRGVGGVASSAEYFRRAIAVDSNYAQAYSGLSLALALFPYFQATPPTVVRDELERVANRALLLDSTLAQPHVALGMAYEQNFEWDRAGAEFATALRLDPHDVEAHVQHGRYLMYRGRTREALAAFQAARQDDPASALVLGFVSYIYYVLGEVDSARVINDRALQSNATSFTALNLGSVIRLSDGRRAEARDLALRSRPDWPSSMYVIAATGDPDSTRAKVRALMNRRPRPWLAHTMRAYAMLGMGDTAQALDALEKATDAREIWPAIDPYTDDVFSRVRESPRFRQLLIRVGLADSASTTAVR